MDTYAGMGPLAEGTPTRNMPRSGMAVSSLMQMALSDITDASRMMEDMVLTPLMADVHNLTMEFVPKEQIIKIPGTKDFPGRRLTVDSMSGDWEFRWVGSMQSQDYQVRAQRLMGTLGLIAKMYPVVVEDLTRRGKRINIEAIMKRVWRDGLGERGADNIIEDIPPQELAQIQMEKMLGAITQQMTQEAKQQGTVNAAIGKRTPKPPGGGGGSPSIPASGGDLQSALSRTSTVGGGGAPPIPGLPRGAM